MLSAKSDAAAFLLPLWPEPVEPPVEPAPVALAGAEGVKTGDMKAVVEEDAKRARENQDQDAQAKQEEGEAEAEGSGSSDK